MLVWFHILWFLLLLMQFHFDTSLSVSFNSSTPPRLCRPDQSFALLQFKQTVSVDCSAGPNCLYTDQISKSTINSNMSYPKTSSWEEGTDCCLWDGVTCDAETGYVIGLDLSCSCLHSTLPSNTSLVPLRHLRKLNLAFNHFNMSLIPSEFGRFTSLTHLNVSNSYFSGLIPSAVFSQFPQLVSLDLSWNEQLRFERHSFETMLADLRQIRQFFLYAVNLSSVSVSSFLNLSSSIVSLSLGRNEQQGKLPEQLFNFPYLQELRILDNDFKLEVEFPKSNWSSPLRSLELSSVYIEQPLPTSIGHLKFLEIIDLRSCNLKGSIPVSFVNLTQLIYLDLSGNNMIGQLPPSLFSYFNQLSYLDLSNNQLDGHIPDAFQNLTKLFHVSLKSNQFSGHLPFSVFNLSSIVFLDMSHNKLSGPLPDQVDGLSQLPAIDLSENFLTGRIPSWLFTLPSLLMLDLNNNNFNGPIDQFEHPNSLEYVNMQNNEIYGKIPSSIFALLNLSVLTLASNRLTGISEPKNLPQLNKLRTIDLSDNTLLSFRSGSNASYVLAPNLTFLSLSNCNISEFPYFVRNLEGLRQLYLSNNIIQAIETDMFSKLKLLNRLDLSYNNQLTLSPTNNVNFSLPNLFWLSISSCNISEFPSFVRNLKRLGMLDLPHNRIKVIDADMFSSLKNLANLDLSYNSELSFSPNLSLPLPNLQMLQLSSCNITEFPSFLRNLEKLSLLDLSNNSINGKISRWESEGWNSLSWLDLSNNFLTDIEHYPGMNVKILNLRSNLLGGSFMVPPPSTSYFLISNNKLRGNIPSSICTLKNLQVLDLSDNNLSGTLPNCVGSFSNNLFILDLKRNKFHGNIPDSFSKGNMLQTINLSDNDLDGPLPISLANCSVLEVLNVGNNNINDTFPHWLEALPSLKVLVLRSNNLHGEIVNSNIGSNPFPSLRIFDLSRNKFSGSLPRYFEGFKWMVNSSNEVPRYLGNTDYYHDSVVLTMKGVDIKFERILTIFTSIDMSSNKFRGEIPEIVGKLTSLQVLNFSHNQLTGYIPASMGNLTQLESMDLSSNKLMGQIPTQLTALGFLAVLNLSHNRLVGPIPLGNQFNTFPNDSYAGNLGLCGFPLSKRCGKTEEDEYSDDEVDSESGFEWKAALMGYGCGLVFAISATYIMFTTGKPFWAVKMFEQASNRLKRYLRGKRRRNL